MKVIDIFIKAPLTTKLLTKLGIIPTGWALYYEIYTYYIKHGYTKAAEKYNLNNNDPYRYRDIMEKCVSLKSEEKAALVSELQNIITLLTKN